MPLTDLVGPGLRVVIAGTISARHRAEWEHYYAGPGNQFWFLLHQAGFTPRQLAPDEDGLLAALGVGLTDLVGTPDGFDLPRFLRVVRRARPDAVAFVTKTAAAADESTLVREGNSGWRAEAGTGRQQ